MLIWNIETSVRLWLAINFETLSSHSPKLLFLFMVLSPPWQCSGLIPSSVLRGHFNALMMLLELPISKAYTLACCAISPSTNIYFFCFYLFSFLCLLFLFIFILGATSSCAPGLFLPQCSGSHMWCWGMNQGLHHIQDNCLTHHTFVAFTSPSLSFILLVLWALGSQWRVQEMEETDMEERTEVQRSIFLTFEFP